MTRSEFIRTGEFLGTVIAAAGTLFGVYIALQERSKYSVGKRYKVVKGAMLSPISMEPLKYPELYAKDQVDMIHDLVFSNDTSLVLIEGAQGEPT